MDKKDIIPGGDYGVREPAKPGDDLQRVTVIENVRGGKWKIKWVDPNPGLIDYVKSQNIVVPWKQRRAFLADEQHGEWLAEWIDQSGYPGDQHPTSVAVEQVLETTGESGVYLHR